LHADTISTFPEDRFYALGGMPSRDIAKMLSREQGVELDCLAIAKEKEAGYLPLIAQVEPINTVVGIAREHYGKIPMAVASGGTHRVIEHVLEHLGIRHLFKAVVTSEDVMNQKPAPDISWRRPDALVCRRNSAAPTKTPTSALRQFAPLAWRRWMLEVIS
jgi:beta-phosphoglucomutase-like phosphatase (HAD superfamily)